MLFSIMGALSEFERDLIVERTVAGIQAAKARGVIVGRPRSMSHEQVQHAKVLVEGGEPKRKVARLFKVSTATCCGTVRCGRTSLRFLGEVRRRLL